jgi:polar amino acid transport system substrate-binding protein
MMKNQATMKQSQILVHIIIRLYILIILSVVSIPQSFGQDSKPQRKLKVALRESPPFVIQKNGDYSGVSVDLWEKIAPGLNVDYEYVGFSDLGKMIQAIETEAVDICINPLTVTSSRLTRFSFTQPYFISGMAIAIRAKEGSAIMVFINNLLSTEFLQVVLLLFGIIFIFGFIIWLVERNRNPDQFGKGLKGLGHGIWWSAVTMTTVGYGDKAPSSVVGRLISIVWMFTAIIIISSFTASISAALTYNKLKTDIRGLQDLRNVRVGTVKNSSTAAYLSESHLKYQSYETLNDAIIELAAGRLHAVVYDEPLLSYVIHADRLTDRIELVPAGANSVYFGFASRDLEFLQEINPKLLEIMESKSWRKMLESYNLRLD